MPASHRTLVRTRKPAEVQPSREGYRSAEIVIIATLFRVGHPAFVDTGRGWRPNAWATNC